MKFKAKLGIVIGCCIIIVLSSGIYLNYKLDNLLQQSGSLLLGQDIISSGDSSNIASAEQESKTAEKSGKAGVKTSLQTETSANQSQLNLSVADKQNLVSDIEDKVGQPIAKIDLLKVSIIAMRNLSAEDISYLSKMALQKSYSQEDYQQSREILIENLSAEDINTIQQIGKKYGKELNILYTNTKS